MPSYFGVDDGHPSHRAHQDRETVVVVLHPVGDHRRQHRGRFDGDDDALLSNSVRYDDRVRTKPARAVKHAVTGPQACDLDQSVAAGRPATRRPEP